MKTRKSHEILNDARHARPYDWKWCVVPVCAAASLFFGCADPQEAPVRSPSETLSAESAAEENAPEWLFCGIPCDPPTDAELLQEAGEWDLFAGLTPTDVERNAEAMAVDPEMPMLRNSLFACRTADTGENSWLLLLTTGSEWNFENGGSEWNVARGRDLESCFMVLEASVHSDTRHILMTCNPHTGTYDVVCSFDVPSRTMRVLADGTDAIKEPDGTILLKNRKTYLYDENGEPLGAAWFDEWVSPDGGTLRKSDPIQ